MARQESDREDLLREATALVERIELAPPGASEADHIVAGFRREGALSIYFGADPAYHFNPAGELRRAFIDGLLYKAQDGRLVSLERVRTEEEVQLVSRQISVDQQRLVLDHMTQQLAQLDRQIEATELRVIGQVPEEADVLGRVAHWLNTHRSIAVAAKPNAR
jgi:KaiC/GvpD/RAD55 family RecA-like ATPase